MSDKPAKKKKGLGPVVPGPSEPAIGEPLRPTGPASVIRPSTIAIIEKVDGRVNNHRPFIELTPEQRQMALTMASEGKTAKEVRAMLGIETNGFRNYLARYPDFKSQFTAARQEGLEELADSLQTLAADTPDVYRARLQSDNVKWLLSKRKPAKYGDKIEINVNQTIDIRGALEEARKRAQLPPQQTKQSDDSVIDAEHSVISDTYDTPATDYESVDDLLK